jgi:hypothetical protein
MIKLYHIEGLNHSDNMTIVYRPKEKIAINADICGRPAAGGNLPNVNANSVALFRNIRRLKLDVAQHVPIHGNPGPDVLGRSALRVSCKVLNCALVVALASRKGFRRRDDELATIIDRNT